MCLKVEHEDRGTTLNIPSAMDLCALVEQPGMWTTPQGNGKTERNPPLWGQLHKDRFAEQIAELCTRSGWIL